MDLSQLKTFCGDAEPVFMGRPYKNPYPVAETVFYGIVFVLCMLCDGFLAGASIFKEISGEDIAIETILIIAAFILHIIPFTVWGVNLYKKFYLAKAAYYVVTKESVSVINMTEDGDIYATTIKSPTEVYQTKNSLVFVKKEEKLKLKYIPDQAKIIKIFSDTQE